MKNKKEVKDHRKTLHEWDTPEFIPMSRGKRWYIVAGLIFLALILYAVSTGSATMAIVFIAVAIVFMLIEKRKPRKMQVKIMDMGIMYDKRFYPYHHINSFWMVYHPPYVRALYLKIREGSRLRDVKIELNHENPTEIRKLLMEEIPEIEGGTEPMLDLLSRILRIQ